MTAGVLRRYVIKNAFFAILAAVVGLWLLQSVFAYLYEVKDLSDTYTMSKAFLHVLYKSPLFLEEFIPYGALLGAVVGLGILANSSELVVMRASGISSLRIVGWVLQPALLFVILAIAINQYVVPHSNRLAEIERGNTVENKVFSVNGYWTIQQAYQQNPENNKSVKTDGQEILFVDYANTLGEIGQVKRWHLDANGNLKSVSIAQQGHYLHSETNTIAVNDTKHGTQLNPTNGNLGNTGAITATDASTDTTTGNSNAINTINPNAKMLHHWQLENVQNLHILDNLQTKLQKQYSLQLTLPLDPKSVYLLTKNEKDLSLTQLYQHRNFMHSQGKHSIKHELEFWQKLLRPFSVLSLVLVACSFVFGSLRTHSLGLRVVVAVLFGLLFHYLQDLAGFVAIATNWSPLLMVLSPILVSAAFGGYLLTKQK